MYIWLGIIAPWLYKADPKVGLKMILEAINAAKEYGYELIWTLASSLKGA